MAVVQDRQGHLGDLDEKSTAELLDLLHRQEKLQSNLSFLKKLPDKGAKIQAFVDKIQAVLIEKENVDDAARLFQQMTIDANRSRQQRGTGATEDEDEGSDPLHCIVNRAGSSKIVIDEREMGDTQTQVSTTGDATYINSYERVINKADGRRVPKPKGKFLPNRTLKVTHVGEVTQVADAMELEADGDGTEKPSVQDGGDVPPGSKAIETRSRDVVMLKSDEDNRDSGQNPHSDEKFHENPTKPEGVLNQTTEHIPNEALSESNQRHSSTARPHCAEHGSLLQQVRTDSQTQPVGRLKFLYDESLEVAADARRPRHEAAKLISVEESVQLLNEQQNKICALQGHQAAERLAQRLNVKMTPYHPEGMYTSNYRESKPDSDDEDAVASDEEDQEIDYPD